MTMRLINERENVRGVAERWKSQYCHGDGSWSTTINGDTGMVYKRLAALDIETATASQVAEIIGNNTWAGPGDCNECGQSRNVLVELGQDPDYESATARICEDCLRKALALVTSSHVR